jgi:hypothetical protein
MQELSEYRQHLLERMEVAAEEFRQACQAVSDPGAPLEAGGWNVHQIAVHVRDVDGLVYGMRLRRTVTEQDPEFENFDGEAWMAEHYDPGEPLEKILGGFVDNVGEQVAWLKGLPDQAWSRPSRHTAYGSSLTMQTWAERGLAHIEEHLAAVKRGKG